MKASHLVITVFVLTMWGLNFSVLKMGLAEVDPFLLTAGRFLLAAFPAVLFIAKPNVPMKTIAGYGLLFGVGLWGVMALAVKVGISAGMASLLLQTSAFISVIIGAIFFHENVSLCKWFGLLVAAIGLAMIMTVQDGSVTVIGIFLVLLAALSMSLSLVIVKQASIKNMFAFIVWSGLFAPLPLILLTLLTNGVDAFSASANNLTELGVLSILIQAYPVTLFGYYVWNKMVVAYPLSTTAPLTLLIPVFGFLGSWYYYDEGFTDIKLVACLCIISGILVNTFEPMLMRLFEKRLLAINIVVKRLANKFPR